MLSMDTLQMEGKSMTFILPQRTRKRMSFILENYTMEFVTRVQKKLNYVTIVHIKQQRVQRMENHL